MGFTVGISNIEMILIKPVIDGSVHIDTDCLGVAPSDFLGLINLVACVYLVRENPAALGVDLPVDSKRS